MRIKLSFLIFSLLLISCRKENISNKNKQAAFEDLHESIFRYSASIEERKVNWDSLGKVYRARITEEMSDAQYFDQIGELLRHFRDPHIWLISPEKTMYTIDHLNYTKNFDDSLLSEKYLLAEKWHSEFIQSAFINDTIAYLRCLNFKGDIARTNEIYTSVLNRLKNTDGLIIDLRFNDGGSVYNAQNLLNKLTDTRTFWHTTQNKTLEGFDEKREWYIEPDPNVNYSKKIILLTGRYTISAGERFAMGAKKMAKLLVVGDTTSNTQGSVMGREMLNGWEYTFTFEKCLTPEGENFAGKGVPPDYTIDSQEAIVDEMDNVLEVAIDLLN